jgi:glycerate kinase
MHILIAPNAFKNSLSAPEAAEAIRQGLLQSGLPCSLQSFPIGDGGDGTADLIIQHLNARKIKTQSTDPLGRRINTFMGFINEDKTAIIEMAESSGLKLLKPEEFDPLRASSYGTGELIRKALDTGAGRIILCIGGSATIDGGCGILRALGIRFLDQAKTDLSVIPENLVHLDSIDVSGLDKRILETELIVLCDVDNFLLGETGAAAVFGPQKGASAEDVLLLEKALSKLREVSLLKTGHNMNTIRHGGAAGGTAAGLFVFLRAKIKQGIEYFLDITQFDAALELADLVITGEGSIDLQTLEGKGPFGVARRARKKGLGVIGLAGAVPPEDNVQLSHYFDVLLAIGHQPEDLKMAMEHTALNLQHAALQIGNLLQVRLSKS